MLAGLEDAGDVTVAVLGSVKDVLPDDPVARDGTPAIVAELREATDGIGRIEPPLLRAARVIDADAIGDVVDGLGLPGQVLGMVGIRRAIRVHSQTAAEDGEVSALGLGMAGDQGDSLTLRCEDLTLQDGALYRTGSRTGRQGRERECRGCRGRSRSGDGYELGVFRLGASADAGESCRHHKGMPHRDLPGSRSRVAHLHFDFALNLSGARTAPQGMRSDELPN